MASSAPEPQPEGKADVASTSGGVQPRSYDEPAPRRSGLPPVSIPDHDLLRCIGRGAYGAVWLARNVMGTCRAVKVVHRDDFSKDRPFLREYEGLLKFEPISRSHPNLMQILHVGRRDGYFYYVTELADDARHLEIQRPGCEVEAQESQTALCLSPTSVAAYVPRTLQEDLERRRRLPVPECVTLATSLASALKHLHEHELVHRDVKPSNVIFVHGVPKLADIGLVATVGDSRSIVGTEGFLPPEGPGSRQADLYSLGKLLYELSTGMNRGEYPRLPKNVGDLPDAGQLLEFNEVLLKACAKDTEKRYHQADELLADLALLERGDSVKRLRRLERHHALLKRVGIGALAIALIGSVAWWESWRAHRIANRHLAQLHVREGTQHMVAGDYAAALPWLVGALALDSGNSHLERVHRTRTGEVLQRCPKPVGHFSSPGSKVLAADVNPSGSLLATAHDDGWVRLWNTATGKQTAQLPHNYQVVLCQFLPSGDRILTATIGQKAHLWDLARPEEGPFTVNQATEAGSDLYSVGLNETLGRAYLSKAWYCFARSQACKTPFENLTLSLKLVGTGDSLLASYEVRHNGGENAVLYQDEFLDSPKADRFDYGRDEPPAPLWGKVLLALESCSRGNLPGDSGRVVWDNVQVRRYPSGEPPTPWRVMDDFSSEVVTNWLHVALREEGRACRVENGRLVLTCARLPRAQTPDGLVAHLDALEISPTHTLEVKVDMISAQAPHPMVGLTLCRPRVSPFTAPDRPFVANGRWLLSTWWDGPVQIWDLEESPRPTVQGGRSHQALEIGRGNIVRDADMSSDGKHLVLVEAPSQCAVWNVETGLEATIPSSLRTGVTGVRFSPDTRFLALSHREGMALIRTTDWQPIMTLGEGISFDQPRFSPRGYRLAGVRDGHEVVVWDLGDLTEPVITFPHQVNIQRIAFSPDGTYLASSAEDRTVQVWNVVRREAFGPPLPGILPRFSADGTQLLVLGVNDGVWVWDLSCITDETLLVPPLRGGQATAFSTDRTLAAEIESQGTSLKTSAGQYLLAHPSKVPLRRVAFSPDDRHLITEGSDLRAWVWDLRTRTLLGPPRLTGYDTALTDHSLPPFPLEDRQQQTLSELAALLGKQRPDREGGMVPVDENERAQLLHGLKRSHPSEFVANDAIRLRWHREQARAAELSMNWDAAVFHWEHVIKVEAGVRHTSAEIPADSRLAYARLAAQVLQQALLRGRSRWSVTLPRPPWATTGMLDLSDFYTLALGETLVEGQSGCSFRSLASGVRILGGTGFDVRGIIHLQRTNQVVIPVDRTCQRLHFLHAASQAAAGNREPAGSYQILFLSGEEVSVQLINPEDIPPYTPDRFHEISPISLTNASLGLHTDVVWSGSSSGRERRQDVLYLTRTTWELPVSHRHEVVKSIELHAGKADSAPLVFAITVE